MTHLTRLTLNPHSSTVGWDIRDRENLHRSVMSLLPDNIPDPRVTAGLLYRLDSTQAGHTLLVQTHDRLDTSRLRAGYAARVEERDITALLDWLQADCTVHYLVDVGASISQPRPGMKRGSRESISGPAVEPWWSRKAAEAGLAVHPETAAYRRSDATLRRRRLPLKLTRCEGVATVTDPDALRHAITTGVGRERAWGAGLLTIAPAPYH